jgi:hypothetical protein
MRRFCSMFVRERGRLFRRRRNVMQRVIATRLSADFLNGVAGDWAPWLLTPEDNVDRYREEIADRLRREAGLEPSEGADWKELLDQRARETAWRGDAGLATLEELMGAPDGWRERVDAERRAEVAGFAGWETLQAQRASLDRVARAVEGLRAPIPFWKICMRFMQKIFAALRQV